VSSPSDEPELRYDFDFTWHSTYGKAATLLGQLTDRGHADRGLVVDLGCGPGVFSRPLHELGFDYVGFDADRAALEAAAQRGIEAEPIDLTDVDAAADRIVEVVGERAVAAVSLIDTIEHLADPDRVLAGVARLIDTLPPAGAPPMLVVSIPNVSHVDLGVKLVTGRWDVTTVGLLDDTHITLFTEQRVHDVMTRAGFVELGADDTVFDRTEQDFPPDHPALARRATLSTFLRGLRRRSGPADETYQFVRCYRRATSDELHRSVAGLPPRPTGRPDDPSAVLAEPFCSVVVRTQGGRASLVDTLVSLAAQTDRDIEVKVMVHHDDPAVHRTVAGLVETFEPAFASCVEVVHVVGGGRSRPLNDALRRVTGRYLAVLDDDDVVTAHWVESFRAAAQAGPGTVVRAPCVVQWTERQEGTAHVAPVSGFEAVHPTTFDYLDHVRRNRSPQCSYALPLGAVRALDIWFDEDLEACEDWKFLMQVARWTGVTDVDLDAGPESVTSIYRRSRDGEGADTVVGDERWARDHMAVAHSLAEDVSLVPAGALLKIRGLYEAIEEAERREAGAAEEIQALRHRIASLEQSRFWRMTSPLRRVAALRSRFSDREQTG
jgi:SAM-dependent methyltransferase